MKKSMKHPAIFALIIFSVFILSSCFDPIPEDLPIYLSSAHNDIAKPEGSIVSAMNENVTISFPPGAVDRAVKLTVKECDNTNDCPFLMKMIRIDPMMVFNAPVTVRLNCNGDLLLGNEPPAENCPLIICYWENEEEYRDRASVRCISCCMDTEAGTINFSITQTGIFALGIKNNGSFY